VYNDLLHIQIFCTAKSSETLQESQKCQEPIADFGSERYRLTSKKLPIKGSWDPFQNQNFNGCSRQSTLFRVQENHQIEKV
jgi:hypothetical protein